MLSFRGRRWGCLSLSFTVSLSLSRSISVSLALPDPPSWLLSLHSFEILLARWSTIAVLFMSSLVTYLLHFSRSSSMEKDGAFKGRLLLTALVGILAFLRFQAADAMLISIRNDMPGPLSVHCFGKDKEELGLRTVDVGKTYDFTVPGHFFSGRRYSCTFESAGKPTTTFDVFIGWGGTHDSPCGCYRDVCPWVVNNNGFACNHNAYTRPWGN